MEVRSNIEQCGNDAAAAVASQTTSINKSMELNESAHATRVAFEMDQSRTTVNVDEKKQPLTRDESEYQEQFF